ncbi:MAG: sigma-70 family RNA polymerase sigma factor [Acidobacteriaceae bacterium]
MQLTLDASIAQVEPLAGEASDLDDMETLVRKYRPRLLRFVAFSVNDADMAESITQDCLLKAYNARDRFRNDCSINTWLTSIAVNLIRDQLRLKKFRFWRDANATSIEVTEAANFLPSPQSSPEALLLVKEKTSQVYAALQNLSPKQRTIFLMRFVQEMELSEISAATDIPINTVKTHLHRALSSVRSQVRTAQAAKPEAAFASARPAKPAPAHASPSLRRPAPPLHPATETHICSPTQAPTQTAKGAS